MSNNRINTSPKCAMV